MTVLLSASQVHGRIAAPILSGYATTTLRSGFTSPKTLVSAQDASTGRCLAGWLTVRIALLKRADAARAILTLVSSAASTLLDSLADELIQVRVDLMQYVETYSFREVDATVSLPAQVPYAVEMAGAARSCPRQALQLAATVLEEAVGDRAYLLRRRSRPFEGTTDETLQHYARDHGHID